MVTLLALVNLCTRCYKILAFNLSFPALLVWSLQFLLPVSHCPWFLINNHESC
jgi:hypothetical protein